GCCGRWPMMTIGPEARVVLPSTRVTDQHRGRQAIVYVRQSTTKQVQQHRESQHNQYALVERAFALGWVPERVRVIDADQGRSSAASIASTCRPDRCGCRTGG